MDERSARRNRAGRRLDGGHLEGERTARNRRRTPQQTVRPARRRPRRRRRRRRVTSLTNVLGSNTFNLLVAIPVGVVLSGPATVNFLAAIPLMGFLAFATLVFIVFTRTHLELTRREAYVFLALYAAFLCWMGLETTGVVETVRGI